MQPFLGLQIRKQHPVVQENFNYVVQAVKTARKQMEAEFIRVVE